MFKDCIIARIAIRRRSKDKIIIIIFFFGYIKSNTATKSNLSSESKIFSSNHIIATSNSIHYNISCYSLRRKFVFAYTWICSILSSSISACVIHIYLCSLRISDIVKVKRFCDFIVIEIFDSICYSVRTLFLCHKGVIFFIVNCVSYIIDILTFAIHFCNWNLIINWNSFTCRTIGSFSCSSYAWKINLNANNCTIRYSCCPICNKAITTCVLITISIVITIFNSERFASRSDECLAILIYLIESISKLVFLVIQSRSIFNKYSSIDIVVAVFSLELDNTVTVSQADINETIFTVINVRNAWTVCIKNIVLGICSRENLFAIFIQNWWKRNDDIFVFIVSFKRLT